MPGLALPCRVHTVHQLSDIARTSDTECVGVRGDSARTPWTRHYRMVREPTALPLQIRKCASQNIAVGDEQKCGRV
jgi:hypothetical protein